MCGEMAGDGRYTRLLLGMGLREFSVHPNALLEVKQIIGETRIGSGPQAHAAHPALHAFRHAPRPDR